MIASSCLIFPFSKINANAISALLASLDIHPELGHLDVYLPKLQDDPQSLKGIITKYDQVVVAFSVFSTQVDEISVKIKSYKQLLMKKPHLIIAGGPHPIGDPFSMLINGAHLVCYTEGEMVIREILIRFIMNNSPEKSLGTAYLSETGKLIRNNKPALIDLDDFPPFSIKHKLIRPIEITRGCAWNCRFCQIRARGVPVRHRSISEITKYVKLTVEYFHKRRPDIRFISPNALSYGADDGKTLQLNRVEELLHQIRDIIGKEGKIYFGSFPSEIRPETINPESVKILKKYTNVKKIIVGGQSGSDRILEYADRGHSVEETEKAVKLLISAGFEVDVDMIFGLPDEGENDIKLTLEHMDKLTKLGATIHSHTFLPLVGTPFASKEPGKIQPQYLPVITELQKNRKLSGFHVKQEREAKKMATRKIKEKEYKNQLRFR